MKVAVKNWNTAQIPQLTGRFRKNTEFAVHEKQWNLRKHSAKKYAQIPNISVHTSYCLSTWIWSITAENTTTRFTTHFIFTVQLECLIKTFTKRICKTTVFIKYSCPSSSNTDFVHLQHCWCSFRHCLFLYWVAQHFRKLLFLRQ